MLSNFFPVVTVHITVHILLYTIYTFCTIHVSIDLRLKHVHVHVSQYMFCHSFLLTTDSGRKKVSTGCYFFACLVFSPNYINVFVTDLTVDKVVADVQGFSCVILIFLCKKLCVKCEGIWSNMWLPYMVNEQHSLCKTHSRKY